MTQFRCSLNDSSKGYVVDEVTSAFFACTVLIAISMPLTEARYTVPKAPWPNLCVSSTLFSKSSPDHLKSVVTWVLCFTLNGPVDTAGFDARIFNHLLLDPATHKHAYYVDMAIVEGSLLETISILFSISSCVGSR
jgi:hypothetical protein